MMGGKTKMKRQKTETSIAIRKRVAKPSRHGKLAPLGAPPGFHQNLSTSISAPKGTAEKNACIMMLRRGYQCEALTVSCASGPHAHDSNCSGLEITKLGTPNSFRFEDGLTRYYVWKDASQTVLLVFDMAEKGLARLRKLSEKLNTIQDWHSAVVVAEKRPQNWLERKIEILEASLFGFNRLDVPPFTVYHQIHIAKEEAVLRDYGLLYSNSLDVGGDYTASFK